MKVAELIAVLQKMDPNASIVAPFSPNPADINIEEVGGAVTRERVPFPGTVELVRNYSIKAVRAEASKDSL